MSFLVLVYFGLLAHAGVGILDDFLVGGLPTEYFVTICILAILPIFSILICFKKFYRRRDLQIRFFYGVEAPLILLTFIRIFLLRELNSASAFIVASVMLAAFWYAWYLIRVANNSFAYSLVTIVFTSLLLVIAVYIGIVVGIYVPPFSWYAAKSFFSFEWLYSYFDSLSRIGNSNQHFLLVFWWMPITFIFILLTTCSFILFPLSAMYYYGKAWRENLVLKHDSSKITLFITSSFFCFWLVLFFYFNTQSQTRIFKLLSEPIVTQSQKREILKDLSAVRDGLLNAYLYRYRYLANKGEVNHIEVLYKDVFGLSDAICEALQNIYNTALSPVLYQGNSNDDDKAAELYASIFDNQIQLAEKDAVIKALQSTVERDQVNAGLLNINQRKVFLSEQELNVNFDEKNQSYNVELYEVYENKTLENQEIFYYFTLPENSAVTGLWLGNSSDRSSREGYLVSPRGAAQKVYNDQVRVSVDPALLEQVGPKQYRLRAFPIPRAPIVRPIKSFLDNFFDVPAKEIEIPKMHLWLTYAVIAEQNKSIFPELLEKRNVFWDQKTKRKFNGAEISNSSDWVSAGQKDVISLQNPINYNVDSYEVNVHKTGDNSTISSYNVAFVVDSSYSMLAKRSALIDNLKKHTNSDLYVQPVNENIREISATEITDFVFYGSVTDAELWNQAVLVQEKKSYDAVFILTDKGNYEFSKDKPALLNTNTAIWLVHLDNLAPAYEDQFMYKLLQAGGNISIGLDDAYNTFVVSRNLLPTQRIAGNLIWNFKNNINQSELNHGSPVAAKMLVNYLASQNKEQSIESLDSIHSIAKRYSVVTPYSSMIVLINDLQKQQLEAAENQKDRFDRAVDNGVENLTKPANILVSGVPEPEEWLLYVMSALLLYFIYKRKKATSDIETKFS